MLTRGLARVGVLVGFATAVACAQGAQSSEVGESTSPTEPAEGKGTSSSTSSTSSSGDSPMPSSSSGGSSTSSASSTSSGGSTSSTSSSSGGSTSSTSSSSGGTACVTAPPSNACGVSPQCGCAANETCDVNNTATGAVSCVLAGGGTLGTYCTASTQCAKGMTCQGNACRPYCSTPGTDCAGANLGVCFSPELSAGVTTPNLSVCAVTCDVLAPASACGSNNCLWFAGDKESDCRPAGTKGLYAACNTLVDCQSGLACVDHPLWGYECEDWCRIGGNDCGLFEDCVDVYGANAPTSGGVKLGHCQ